MPVEDTVKHEDEDEGTIDRSIYENGIGDSRGYYHDGAYTALPDDYNEDDEEEEESEEGGQEYDEEDSLQSSEDRPHNSSSDEIRDAYFAALTRQYLSLRTILRTDPPQSAISSLPSSNPTQVGKLGANSSTYARWSGLIKATDPLPAQIAAMHKDSVIRLVRVMLNGKSFREGHELRERTSRWLWALLARLPDRGELDYQEIGWIRELGKRAVLCMLNLAEREVLHNEYGVGGSGASQEDADVEIDEGVHEEPTPPSQDEEPDGSINLQTNGPTDNQNGIPGKADTTSVGANIRPSEESHLPNPISQQTTAPSADANADTKQSPVRSSSPHPRTEQEQGQEQEQEQEQETAETPDVEMQLESDLDDGEVSDNPQKEEEHDADIEGAKARLLAQLEDGEESSPEPALTQEQEEAARAQVNLRATLNMILTVAGEFYGQRDLLEFRNPFSRLSDD